MAQNQPSEIEEFEGEYKLIRSDIRRVIITNGLILLVLIGLYYANQKYGFLHTLQNFF